MHDPSSKTAHLEVRQDGSTFWIAPDQKSASLLDSTWFSATKMEVAPRGGRGLVQVLETPKGTAICRHYRRGGKIMARLLHDRYWWPGQVQLTRAYRELQLTNHLYQLEMPVPKPIAARVMRTGFWYRADLLTAQLPQTTMLADRIIERGVENQPWDKIMTSVARLHGVGVDHVDLNAYNILLDDRDAAFVIDFDNCALGEPFAASQKNLLRLLRSINKIIAKYQLPMLSETAVDRMRRAYQWQSDQIKRVRASADNEAAS